jgi:hypothetical protein
MFGENEGGGGNSRCGCLWDDGGDVGGGGIESFAIFAAVFHSHPFVTL